VASIAIDVATRYGLRACVRGLGRGEQRGCAVTAAPLSLCSTPSPHPNPHVQAHTEAHTHHARPVDDQQVRVRGDAHAVRPIKLRPLHTLQCYQVLTRHQVKDLIGTATPGRPPVHRGDTHHSGRHTPPRAHRRVRFAWGSLCSSCSPSLQEGDEEHAPSPASQRTPPPPLPTPHLHQYHPHPGALRPPLPPPTPHIHPPPPHTHTTHTCTSTHLAPVVHGVRDEHIARAGHDHAQGLVQAAILAAPKPNLRRDRGESRQLVSPSPGCSMLAHDSPRGVCGWGCVFGVGRGGEGLKAEAPLSSPRTHEPPCV
jgi:hypothetical protein